LTALGLLFAFIYHHHVDDEEKDTKGKRRRREILYICEGFIVYIVVK